MVFCGFSDDDEKMMHFFDGLDLPTENGKLHVFFGFSF
jgi:hypothetical protein